jgi:hypothetical protein
MRIVNVLLSLMITATMIGCSAHVHAGGKVGRRAAVPQHNAEKVAAQTHDVTARPHAPI